MSKDPLSSKIASPYARALFDYSIKANVLHKVTSDLQNLNTFLKKTPELLKYLDNPVVSKKAKQEIIKKIFKSKLHSTTFNFLDLLVSRDRINLLDYILNNYLELVYATASIKMVEVVTAFPFKNGQKTKLTKKLKILTKAREIRLSINIDPTLIGGFLIKTESKVLDFTIKTKLENLAKHLDSILEI
jgi:F-type H+-transporting ATPase subunit delta